MGERYPAHLPPALAQVLGMPPQQLYPIWMALREVGVAVPPRYEGEVSSALHFLIPFAITHGEDWQAAAAEELIRIRDGGTFTPALISVVKTEALVTALQAATSALRSYQYGNASPDLAASIANIGENALRQAGSAPLLDTKEGKS